MKNAPGDLIFTRQGKATMREITRQLHCIHLLQKNNSEFLTDADISTLNEMHNSSIRALQFLATHDGGTFDGYDIDHEWAGTAHLVGFNAELSDVAGALWNATYGDKPICWSFNS